MVKETRIEIDENSIYLHTMHSGDQTFNWKDFKKKIISDAKDYEIDVVELTDQESKLYSKLIENTSSNTLIDKIAEAIAMKILWRLELR